MALYIKERIQAYLEALFFLIIAFAGVPFVIFDFVFIQRRPFDVLNYEKLTGQIFSRLWLMMAPTLAKHEADTDVPSLVASAHGTVLEIGPGSGNQLPRYDTNKITHIYGIEPNPSLHRPLLDAVKRNGLSDTYTLVPCGITDVSTLQRYGIAEKQFDTILSIQVFCSIPHPKEAAAAIYRLLKPGGELVVYEHVRSGDWLSGWVQRVLQVLWPHGMGGCNLVRDTYSVLEGAGEWERREVRRPGEEDAWMTFPRIWGRWVKVGG